MLYLIYTHLCIELTLIIKKSSKQLTYLPIYYLKYVNRIFNFASLFEQQQQH